MITTDRQYRVTLLALEKLQRAASVKYDFSINIDPTILEAHVSAVSEQIHELEEQIRRYESLTSGRVSFISLENIKKIGSLLIEARIAKRLTQRELATRLGMKEQQIQRYEKEHYQTANLSRLESVAAALNITLDGRVVLQPSVDVEQFAFDPRRLPVKEMRKRGWLDFVGRRSGVTDIDLAAEFVTSAGAGGRLGALHRQNVRTGGKLDEYALLAWKARVLQKARQLNIGENGWDIEVDFIRRLVSSSAEPDGPARAVTMLRESGIAVVFEEHLPQTHLDGAALILENNTPVVALTLRHNRLDNFWFVLLHELAHVLRHRQNLDDGFFDDIDADGELDRMEREADEFARDAMIPREVWNNSLVRFTNIRDTVVDFARKNQISPAIVAGRLRYERRNQNGYTIFNDLVGRGVVRKILLAHNLLEE